MDCSAPHKVDAVRWDSDTRCDRRQLEAGKSKTFQGKTPRCESADPVHSPGNSSVHSPGTPRYIDIVLELYITYGGWSWYLGTGLATSRPRQSPRSRCCLKRCLPGRRTFGRNCQVGWTEWMGRQRLGHLVPKGFLARTAMTRGSRSKV